MRKALQWITIIAAVALLGAAVWLYFNPESKGVKRQETEESLAAAYVEALLREDSQANTSDQSDRETTPVTSEELSETETTQTISEETQEETTPVPSKKSEINDFEDPIYYQRGGVTYTPDYAKGYLDGVLEVPTAGIRRGAYCGTMSDIIFDLDIWMVTVARPDYELGKTHYCIYGHNHPYQNLSFNRLRNVKVGDVFTYTTEDGVYIYDVTDYFAQWREMATTDYVDNFDLPYYKMYIITCGRGEFVCRDLLVEGTLRCIVPLEEYAVNPDYYMTEYKIGEIYMSPEDKAAKEAADTAALNWNRGEVPVGYTEEENPDLIDIKTIVEVDGENGVRIKAVDENGAYVPCIMGLLDEDGMFVERWKQDGDHIVSGLTEDRTYIAAVIEADQAYRIPDGYFFLYKKNRIKAETSIEYDESQEVPRWAKPAMFALGALILLLISLIIWTGAKKAQMAKPAPMPNPDDKPESE